MLRLELLRVTIKKSGNGRRIQGKKKRINPGKVCKESLIKDLS
ncbi:hypothetical protein HMPREF9548_00253 [Escherichia coli MS 182-1]|nr:hypothetical protein HMPREF9548_00253 [Escherichia coli MS 182-1]EFK51286.1 hypothetical protein HMPREF9345_02305 [Escherichia coli MS 107-1]